MMSQSKSRRRPPCDSSPGGAATDFWSPGTLSTAATLYAAATPAQITDLVLGALREGPAQILDHGYIETPPYMGAFT